VVLKRKEPEWRTELSCSSMTRAQYVLDGREQLLPFGSTMSCVLVDIVEDRTNPFIGRDVIHHGSIPAWKTSGVLRHESSPLLI